MGNDHRWFPRSLLSGQRVRHPALPLRHRHDYAIDIHHGLPAQASQTLPEVPHPPSRMSTHRTPAQIHRVSSWHVLKRRNNTGFSRIPSRLAHRAQPIRQS
jgi:hypothetical protein